MFFGIFRSESLPTDIDETKRFKLDINQWKADFIHAQIDTNNRLLSIESTITNVQHRVEQIYQRLEQACTSIIFIR